MMSQMPHDNARLPLSRRTFLRHAATGCAVAAAERVATAAVNASPASQPDFRYAICNETFADWPQAKIFQFAAACGYRGIEIAPFTIEPDVRKISVATRAQLRQQADQAGVELVGLHWLLAKTEGFHLTSPDAEIRRATAAYLVELGRFCHDLGGKVLVFGSPKQRNLLPGVSRQEGVQYAVEVLRTAMPALAQFDVTVALEPLSPRITNFLTTAAEAVEVAERVDSPQCRLLLDCLAMSSESEPIPDLIRKYGSRLAHFHANDPNNQGPGMGDLDFFPILRALEETQYRGWISVEVFDTAPGGETIARRSIEYLRRVANQVRN